MLTVEKLDYIKIRVKALISYFNILLNCEHGYQFAYNYKYPENFHVLLIIRNIENLLESSEYKFNKNFENYIIDWYFGTATKEDILIIIFILNKLMNINLTYHKNLHS